MMSRVGLAVCAVVTLGLAGSQSPPQPIHSGSAGVLIDVSVLDKDGHPVIDLHGDDFEVFEDGKPQRVLSVVLVRDGKSESVPLNEPMTERIGASAPSPQRPDVSGRSAPTVTVTTLVFDQLSAETRPLAARAAAEFVNTMNSGNDYAGVFVAGLGLNTIQRFTNDRDQLLRAVQRVSMTAMTNLSAGAERKNAGVRTQGLDPSSPVTAGADSAQGSSTVADREKRLYDGLEDPGKTRDSEKLLTQLDLRMQEGYSRFATEYEGDTSLSGLRSAVDAMLLLPGRKSILYFSDRLSLTSRLKSKFDGLIGLANRENITIYAVDAAGLRVHSAEAETARVVNAGGAQGVGDANRGNGAYTRELERQSDALSSRPSAALGRLAAETGGFLLDNTNDLSKGTKRTELERSNYYLLGYQPANTALDGRFRRVSVKVKRGKVSVRSRPGYVMSAVDAK